MYDWNNFKNWARHEHFGLRPEWLEMYKQSLSNDNYVWTIGNRQVQSILEWVKTIGLVKKDGALSTLGIVFIKGEISIDNKNFWEIVWVNIVFNLPTARWYAHNVEGKSSWNDINALVMTMVPRLSERTLKNALYALKDSFIRTPIGYDLKQGIFSKVDGEVFVERKGIIPSAKVALYALIKLFAEERRDEIGLDEELTWPWVIFNAPKDEILRLIVSTQEGVVRLQNNRVRLVAKGDVFDKWLDGSMLIT
ncbi:MAG TPA: hypothetical protein GX505_14645 [Clostridiales bacterium]|nr:hypothetical protein [Clostridiales bacterium]